MENFCVSFCFFFPSLIILAMLAPSSTAQLSPSENRTLFQIQKLLEYPEALQGWNNWTSFCYLPPSPSLTIVCTNNKITEFTVIGNKSSPSHSPKPASGKFTVSQQTLSETFSTDSLFTVLAKLSNLKVLSLVSLGLWGPLPAKINRLWSLEVINISSNFIYGEIPSSISTLKNLTSLVLADNLFNGSVPDLKSLVLLQELNLGGNNIGPEFPSLSNSLVSITLSNNSLRSEIPSEVKNFAKLQQFDISSNKFLGPIPPSLFSLPSIQYLSLAQNQLSGVLPMNISCNAELKFVDISQNLLIGKLPSCLGSNSSNRSVIYSWNCLSSSNYSKYQHPSVFCNKEALAVKPPNKSKEESKSNINLGLVLVIIGCVMAIAVVLGLLVLFIVRRAERNRSDDNIYNRSVAEKMSIRSTPRSYIDARRVAQTIRLAALGLPPYRVFTLEEIEEATNNFDPTNLIGEGSQGQLYKVRVRDGSVVLVKSLKLKQKHLSQSLMQHMDVLCKLRHRHLVSILGHCIVTYQDHPNTASTVFIVHEHVSNGSLRDYLNDWRKKDMLNWPQRMAITIGVARGVQFLHTGIAPGIFGNKLKIDNILLDDSLTAKISSYNIPLPFKLDSESPLGGQDNHLRAEIAEKEDIYQLGVILLQVITGKLITSTSETNELKLELERGLTESKLRAATDPSIQGTFAYQRKAISFPRRFLKITISHFLSSSYHIHKTSSKPLYSFLALPNFPKFPFPRRTLPVWLRVFAILGFGSEPESMDWGNVTAEDLIDALREVDWSSPPRPLSEFFSRFTVPRSYAKWSSRLKCNLYYYRTNYFILITVILGLGFIRRPLALVAAFLTALSIAFLNDSFAGTFSEKATRTVRQFSPHLAAKMRPPLTPVIRGRPSAKRAIFICGRPRWVFVFIFANVSLVLWFVSCGLLTVLWALAIGLLVTILHASFRTPNLKARLNTFREEFRAVWRNYSEL